MPKPWPEIDNEWDHHFGSHSVKLPVPGPVPDSKYLVGNYWPVYIDGVLYMQTICQECNYMATKRVHTFTEDVDTDA